LESNKAPSFPNLNINDYSYELPEELIAQYPKRERSKSRLLFYHQGAIDHKNFTDIPDLVPKNSTLFFNDTKVLPARLYFFKETGSRIEIFLLEPIAPSDNFETALNSKETCTWKCMIRNLKKWKDQALFKALHLNDHDLLLSATLLDKAERTVKFSWNSTDLNFREILETIGHVPLPPYIDREDDKMDRPRYQTVYSKKEGAVAAPTAGLHFSKNTILELRKNGIGIDYLTLHVGAGTFLPIKDANPIDHPMHREQMIIMRKNLRNILKATGKIIAVGTTSARTLESLYWYGIRLLKNEDENFFIPKLMPYSCEQEKLPPYKIAIGKVLEYMEQKDLQELQGTTELFILPRYNFKICGGLITNFHLPKSTLILLVAAFIGSDWEKVYEAAVAKKYKLLSYGESSLLLP